MAQVTVKLNPAEKDALRNLAERERRDPRDQAAVVVARELERAGMLPAKIAEPAQVGQAVKA